MKNRLKVIDLFAGCGGLALGFEQAGFEVIAAVDNWKPALEVYKENFSHDVLDLDLGDEASIEVIAKYKPDMIIGGPPCQDFSSAGKRDEDQGRGDLTVSYAKIISKIRPKYFLMENVSRIVKTKKLKEALRIFKNSGYGLSYQILDASYCGAPQARKRFILFGELEGKDHILEQYFEKNKSKKQMTMRDYFEDSLGINHYYRHPRNYNRRGVFSLDEPSMTIRGVNRPIPKGYKGHPNDTAAIASDVRPLTTVERAMVQTFPKDFIWTGKKTDTEQLIGNAVPVKLAEFVAKCILEYKYDKESGKEIISGEGVQLSLEI